MNKKIDPIKVVGRNISTKNQFGFYDQAEQIEDKMFMLIMKLNEIIEVLNSKKEGK